MASKSAFGCDFETIAQILPGDRIDRGVSAAWFAGNRQVSPMVPVGGKLPREVREIMAAHSSGDSDIRIMLVG